MLSFSENNKETAIKAYCQNWLKLLSDKSYLEAEKLIDSENCYGETWKVEQIKAVVQDYYNDAAVNFYYEDIDNCRPELIETIDGALSYGFSLPANGEITGLTVEFGFTSLGNSEYSVCINDLQVM